MITLATLGAVVTIVGGVRTTALVARDGYGRVPTVRQF